MSIKEVLTKILNWIKFPHLHGQVGLDTYYRVTNTDNNTAVAFGIGSSGTRHGVWSTTMGKWMIHSDGTDVYIGETMKVVDTVIEQGTSGIWTYRKWDSGIAECWGMAEISGLSWSSYTTGGIATNYNSSPAQIPMPTSLFTSIESINANTHYAGGNVGWVANASYGSGNVLLTFVRNGNTGVMRACINIKGRWK